MIERTERSWLSVVPALGLAYTGFGLTFRGPRAAFWDRMTFTGLLLGSLSLLVRPRRPGLKFRDGLLGLASAAVLYGIFQVGDRVARRVLPGGERDIDDIYRLRPLRSRPELAARLGLIIGPAEELFWRGFVQPRLAARFGRWRGALAAAGVYGGAHLVTGNVTLVGAATVAGLFWSGMAATGASMGSLIASHICWDVWIFLVAPTSGQKDSQ